MTEIPSFKTGTAFLAYMFLFENISGWIKIDEQHNSIGNGNSQATARANEDTKELFCLIWQYLPSLIIDAFIPDGKGKSALEDFNAGKIIVFANFYTPIYIKL